MGMMLHRHKPVEVKETFVKVTDAPKVIGDDKEKKVAKATKVKK